MRNIIRQAGDACKEKADAKGDRLSLHMPEHAMNAMVDGFNVQRSLINLINNAIEASEENQDIRVTLSAEKKSLMISIRDYGSGMDKETLENIFTPFFSKKKEWRNGTRNAHRQKDCRRA